MNKLILILIIVLGGCTVPVVRDFPQAPDILKEECPNLELVPAGTTKQSDLLITVTDNYALYNDCQIKMRGWIDWYNTQKVIFNKVK